MSMPDDRPVATYSKTSPSNRASDLAVQESTANEHASQYHEMQSKAKLNLNFLLRFDVLGTKRGSTDRKQHIKEHQVSRRLTIEQQRSSQTVAATQDAGWLCNCHAAALQNLTTGAVQRHLITVSTHKLLL